MLQTGWMRSKIVPCPRRRADRRITDCRVIDCKITDCRIKERSLWTGILLSLQLLG